MRGTVQRLGMFCAYAQGVRAWAWSFIAVVVLATATGAGGDSLRWDNPAGGPAWVGDNWDPAGVPDPNDSFTFGLSATYGVSFNAIVNESKTMSFRDGAVSVSLLAPHVTGSMYVGQYAGDVATMSVTDGFLRPTYWDVGWNGATGTMFVTGPDAVCTQEPNTFNDLRLGGTGGTGSLTVDDGGTAWVADDVYVGYSGAASGTLTVTGTGYIGSGEYQRSSLTSLSEFGSLLMYVGVEAGGAGVVDILDGGLVRAGFAYIGNDPGSSGEVTVGGVSHSKYATLEVEQTLRIGNLGGTGTLTIDGDGGVTVERTTYLGAASGETGTLEMNGGNLRTPDLLIAETGELVFSSGNLYVEGGSFTTAGAPSLDMGGSLHLEEGATGDIYAGGINIGTAAASGYLNIKDGSDLTTGPTRIANGKICQVALSGEDFAGAGSRWRVTGDLDVDHENSGTLRIYEGGSTVVDGSVYVGRENGSQGQVVLEGASSNDTTGRLEVGGSLRIGGYKSSGYGDVLIAAGCVVEVSGVDMSVGYGGGEATLADGVLRVTGLDEVAASRSTLTAPAASLVCGHYGTAEIDIDDGGLLEVGLDASLGDVGAPTTTVVTVTGVHATGQRSELVVGGDLKVGYLAEAELHILQGAAATGGGLVVGDNRDRGGVVEVLGGSSGLRSTLHVSGAADIGYYGPGGVAVRDGALLEIENMGAGEETRIAYAEGIEGAVTVEGTAVDGTPSSWINGGDLTIGRRGSGLVNILDGAEARAGTTYVAKEPYGASSTLTVSGFGSSFEAANLYVGGSDAERGGTGRVEVCGDAALDVAGTLKVWRDGSVAVSGSSLSVGGLAGDYNPGALAFESGALAVAGDLALGGSGPLYPILSLDPARRLSVGGTTTIGAGASLTVDGGSFATGHLVKSGSFAFVSGELALTGSSLLVGAAGLLGDDVLLDATKSLSVSGTTTVDSGATLTVDGGRFSSRYLVAAGSVYLHGHDVDVLAGVTVQPSGRVSVGNARSVDVAAPVANMGRIELMGGGARLGRGATLDNTGLIVGDGEIAKRTRNLPGGEIRAEAGKRLLFSDTNETNNGQINLQGGTAEFAQPLTNGVFGDIVGRGALIVRGGLVNYGDVAFSSDTTDVIGDANNSTGGGVIVSGRADVTFWDDVHNAGAMFRVSADSSATFFGDFSGLGITGDGEKYFEADVTPGFSAAAIGFGGSVTFGPMANLKIELANPDNSDPLAPRFDALAVAGDATLGGTLSLSWLPVPGDPNSKFGGVYTILAYGGSRNGTAFDGVDCRMAAYLDDSIFADGIEYDDANGEVKVHLHDLIDGDADIDGRVGRDDFLALRDGFGATNPDWSTGDFNFDGQVDALDYLNWKLNVGNSVPGVVPEPATLSLLALGGLAVLRRRKK